jgi:hypothetical protein
MVFATTYRAIFMCLTEPRGASGSLGCDNLSDEVSESAKIDRAPKIWIYRSRSLAGDDPHTCTLYGIMKDCEGELQWGWASLPISVQAWEAAGIVEGQWNTGGSFWQIGHPAFPGGSPWTPPAPSPLVLGPGIVGARAAAELLR